MSYRNMAMPMQMHYPVQQRPQRAYYDPEAQRHMYAPPQSRGGCTPCCLVWIIIATIAVLTAIVVVVFIIMRDSSDIKNYNRDRILKFHRDGEVLTCPSNGLPGFPSGRRPVCGANSLYLLRYKDFVIKAYLEDDEKHLKSYKEDIATGSKLAELDSAKCISVIAKSSGSIPFSAVSKLMDADFTQNVMNIQRTLAGKLLAGLESKKILFTIQPFAGKHTMADVMFSHNRDVNQMNNSMKPSGNIPESLIKFWVKQLLEIVQELESKNIIHADLQPANVVISDKGQVRLVDWGLTKFHNGSSKVTLFDNVRCTPPIWLKKVLDKVLSGVSTCTDGSVTMPNWDAKAVDVWSILNAILPAMFLGADFSNVLMYNLASIDGLYCGNVFAGEGEDIMQPAIYTALDMESRLDAYNSTYSREAKNFIKFAFDPEIWTKESGGSQKMSLSGKQIIQRCLNHAWLKNVSTSKVPREWSAVERKLRAYESRS